MTSEVISSQTPIETGLTDSNLGSDTAIQQKLVIREGQLRVEQVSAEIKSNDGSSDLIKLDTSNISMASETQTSPEKPDMVTMMGGFDDCRTWLLSYIASTIQYQRGENDIYNKIKREFSLFSEKEEVLHQLRNVVSKISLIDLDEEVVHDKLYRTTNNVRYLVDSCITLHFFMKGSSGVERTIKDHHQEWFEDQSWEELGITHDAFQKILKGKVYKAMNGAIASKYSNWAGVKDFTQRLTYTNNNHSIKFSELYRLMKKDFAAPHDIIRHMRMEDVLFHCVSNIPGMKVIGTEDDRKVTTDPDVLKLIKKVKHLQQNGVKNIAKEFSSFYPHSRDWTSYHMTYQKMNQHFRNVLNPNGNRRRSKSTIQDESRPEPIYSVVLDSSSKQRIHTYQAIGINTASEKKRSSSRNDDDRHVTYTERGEATRSRSNSMAEREDSTTVYFNTDRRSVVGVIGLPGSGKTTTLATLLSKAHTADTPSTVLILSSDCCTTNMILEYTSGTVLRACPAVTPGMKKREQETDSEKECPDAADSSDSFIVHDDVSEDDHKSDEYERVDTPPAIVCTPPESLEEGEIKEEEVPSETAAAAATESDKKKQEEVDTPKVDTPKVVTPKVDTPKVDTPKDNSDTATKSGKERAKKDSCDEIDEFKKTELPWKVYSDITEILNVDSEGRITAIHFPNYDDMDAEMVCGVLEQFTAIPSKYPKILIIDNPEVLCHPCNSNTLDTLIEGHRRNGMSVWVSGTAPQTLPINILDFATLTVLHQFTSKYWYSELSDHLSLTSATYQLCQGLTPGHCVLVAPGAHMQHPVHSSSYCYPCNIITPTAVTL